MVARTGQPSFGASMVLDYFRAIFFLSCWAPNWQGSAFCLCCSPRLPEVNVIYPGWPFLSLLPCSQCLSCLQSLAAVTPHPCGCPLLPGLWQDTVPQSQGPAGLWSSLCWSLPCLWMQEVGLCPVAVCPVPLPSVKRNVCKGHGSLLFSVNLLSRAALCKKTSFHLSVKKRWYSGLLFPTGHPCTVWPLGGGTSVSCLCRLTVARMVFIILGLGF